VAAFAVALRCPFLENFVKPIDTKAKAKSDLPPGFKRPATMTIKQFCALVQISRSSAYVLIKTQRIQSVRVLGRNFITTRSVEKLLADGMGEGCQEGFF
jgi:hypothetical protein